MDRRTIVFVILMTATFYLVNHFLFPSKTPPVNAVAAMETIAPVPAALQAKDERFYVIENEYQQLVVSSINGSLAEINLPLESPDNPQKRRQENLGRRCDAKRSFSS